MRSCGENSVTPGGCGRPGRREAEAHPDHPLQATDRFHVWHASPLVSIIEKAEMAMARATAELGCSPSPTADAVSRLIAWT